MKINANKRIISLVLALTLCLQLLPATLVTATEVSEPTETFIAEAATETTVEIVPETTAETVPETTVETVPETTVETVPETTAETVPETTAETVPETTEETIPETTEDFSEADPDPWEIIAACGGPKTPYVFGPDITYTLPTLQNEAESAAAFSAREYQYTIASLDLLKKLLNDSHTSTTEIEWSENALTSMPLDAGKQLILLSVTDPQVYQRTKFSTGSFTGAISLSDPVTLADGSSLTFQGLGSADCPFQGSFANSSFTVRHTLFNALDGSEASFSSNTLTIDWDEPDNSKGAIVATKITGANDKPLTVNINSGKKYSFRDAAFGEISGSLDLTISFSKDSAFENTSSDNNAGLVANTVTNGILALTVSSFPSGITIGINNDDNTTNNAGLLVGYLNNASLTLNNDVTPPTAIIQAPKGGAGGIVGRVAHSDVSTITLNGDIDLNKVTILGKYTGGIAGYAKDVAFAFGGSNTITLPGSLGVKANIIVGTGDASSQYTGGIFGWYECGNKSAYSSFDGSGFSFPADPIALNVNGASGEAGALFGRLDLGTGRSFTVAGTSPLNISSKIVVADTTVKSAGGLVGALVGESKADQLTVGADVTVSVADVTKDKIKYLGGLVGSVETASVSVTDVTVTVPQPSAATYFGGLVASLGAHCVLKTTGTVTVSTQTTAIAKGGGLVGEAKPVSVVQLSGTTDLSSVAYTAGATVGQLVATQDSALIFATGNGSNDGWIYQRSTAKARVDDIGNYGQVIRLGGKLSKNLISFGTGNQVCFSSGSTETYGTISSADDFALHAIAFTTNNVFGLYNKTSSNTIKTTSVTLTQDVDLTGTGIQGLTRDNGSDQWDGSAGNAGVTFDGGTHTLTINTGEIYGKRGNGAASGEGSGQCYRHGYYGLMGKVNSAIVQNLTINTTMNVGADVPTYAGAVFGYVSGGYSKNGRVNTLDTVTLIAGSTINLDGTPPTNTYSHVGGLIGYVAGDETGVTVNNSFMQGDIAYTGTSDSVMLGGILGKDNYAASIDLQFEGVTVGGTISTSTTNNAHVGGLVADICASSDASRNKNGAKMSLKNVVVSSTITTSAKTTSGGLLGYYWDNVDVTFDGGTGADTPYAVTTYSGDTLASLTASGGAAAGGLCFAATGQWNMQGKAVDMGSASISNGSGALGLLVCHGERQGSKPGAYTNGENAKALYLVMDTEWDTAYHNKGVVISNSSAVFDEIVAYTARSNMATTNPVYDITRNDAGIISLHTTGDKVSMTSGDRNTYVNRTGYGKTKQTNPYSRYYYNLDRMGTPAGDVDTPEELLLWSVGKYCAANIGGYLSLPASNTITGTLDMDGYSYYPVSVGNTNVTISAAKITFHNTAIEGLESGNKSTLAASVENRTQHFTMHSGLLYHYYTDETASSSATLTVNDLTLLGTVGMVGSGSGALICGKIYGYDGKNSAKLELNTLKVDRGDNLLSVASFNPYYAPLLINSVGSYAVLNLTGVTAGATETAGATSLMGNVGDASATGITLTLSKMKLPDEPGRFTKATMLRSLHYAQNSSATYNFTKEEDWGGENHIHNVTYGKEIGGTAEYAESVSNPHQYHYAQSDENVSYSGTKFVGEDRDSFTDYLPYVAQAYNADNGYHEIQVNSYLENINTGCGTYGDPYRISMESELQSIAIYLATGVASNGWTLNIPSNDGNGNSAFCGGNTPKTHKTYTYRGGNWIEQQNTQTAAEGGEASEPVTLTNATVRAYLNNAYYQIKEDIEVSNFTGFGTQANPFRGVIVGANVPVENSSNTRPATITLKGTLPQGFIVYSYGSVVKNLKLDVQGTATVSFAEIKNNQGYTSESFFGGVIGCILGGDNIIDNVDVTYTESNVTLVGTRTWLVPIGGYVGVISGGGVIFRGNITLASVPNRYVINDNYFYANPYVGRVIQGFAVQEGGTPLNNSDKNYQICQLASDNAAGISVSESTITLSDAQALLVFSSVTNSGGAGGGKVLPYFSSARTYWHGTAFGATSVGGKVRNASYNGVGTVTDQNDADYRISLADDYAAVSSTNASYLDTHYANRQLYSVCHTSTAYSINLVNITYDMTAYGNGYRSISPRYLANAVCSSATDSTVGSNYQYLNPLISGFNGNGATIKTNIVSKEYVDDDHHAIAVGGVFNSVRFTNNVTFQKVIIGGTVGSPGNIAHQYYEWDGAKLIDATFKNWGSRKQGFTNLNYEQGRGLVAVGGFAGNNVAVNYDADVKFQKINTEYLNIIGPFDAGGIIGHTGLRVNSTEANYHTASKNYHICYLADENEKYVVPTFQNCSYQNLIIYGGMMVGGYIGFAAYSTYAPFSSGKNDKLINIEFDKDSDGKLGQNSDIRCKRGKTDDGIDNAQRVNKGGKLQCLPAVGGLIGCSSMAVKIDNSKTATIENVEVRSTRSAGGVIAWALSTVTINNLAVKGDETKRNQIGDLPDWSSNTSVTAEPNTICEFAGGLVGYFEPSSRSIRVTNCVVSNLQIVASLRNSYPCYAAGIVGNINGSADHTISNCSVKNLILANTKYSNSSKVFYCGGLVGRLQAGNLYGANLLADGIQYKHSDNSVSSGNLLGTADSGKTVYLAGVSIQNTTSLNTVLQTDIGTKPTKCYVAYADYAGAAQKESFTPPETEADLSGSVVPHAAAPHVTTSPRGVEIPIGPKDAEGNQQKLYLYGDGANPEVVGIISTQRSNVDKARFYYSAASGCSFNSKSSSKFHTEMGLTAETANGIPDFPVLQVPVADKTTVSDQIVDYLNLVTNNGYSTARDTNVGASSHISSFIDLYRWNEAGYFEKNPSGVAKAFSGSGDSFETSFTNYDSGNNQFELLTVTFAEQGYQYSVQVPIVVRRMLEVDFTATLKDSPSFKASDYEVYKEDGFKPNITVGYGVSVSAMLTYTYNRAIGEPQTFGWQSHLDSGSFMGDPEQTIQFYNPNSKLKSLPTGTQLILLDCADNNKAYRYKVTAQSESEGTNVKLSDFLDSQGYPYSPHWLSEIMGVTATQNDNGKWVLLDKETGATARIKTENGYQYFRAKMEGDKDPTKLYNLTAATDASGQEPQPTEQFYLVIYIPDSSVEGIPETSGDDGKNLNGYISTTLPGLDKKIACNINTVIVKRDGKVVTDSHSSSESTYNFLSGYVQSLSDQSADKSHKQETDPEAYILLEQTEADGNYLLHMDLVDEITVVKGQKDTADTPLYFKADISLPRYAKGETDAVSLVTANGFPTGCYGTADFYVYLQNNSGDKTYYTWSENGWVQAANKQKALSYEWTASGGNMELHLGTANTPNVSLAAIRQQAKNGNEKFYVETKMDIHMSVPAAEQVIAGAITKGNAYTKLSYTAYLASTSDGFSSTNYVESKQGEVRYYQFRSGSSTLTHSANDPTQLGINCSDLTSANGVIYTTGVYDLTTVSNAENLIKDADRVEYTLTLWQRQENGEYKQIVRYLDKYVRSVYMNNQQVAASDSQWQWTDTKTSKFGTTDPENIKRFLLPIRVQVNTDVETNGVTFANYQLRLTATLYQDGKVLDQPVNKEIQNEGKTEYIRYDYVTYTITRLLTSGYWG